MGLFGKKISANVIRDDKSQLAEACDKIEIFYVLAKDDPAIIERLKLLQEKLRYANPSGDRDAQKLTGKILSKLSDMKTAYTKARTPQDISGMLQELEVMYAEREAYAKRKTYQKR